MRKKSQTEIMGLLTIVVLFIFIGLIYIMLAGKADKGSLTRDVVQSEKVQSLLSSFMQLTPCYSKVPYDQMDVIIKECYTSSGGLVCGEPCKEFIIAEMDDVMKAYNPRQEYEFKILKGKEEFISKGGCTGASETKAGSVDLRDITIRLTYCIK
ncbi:hypothetical protein FJZ53_02990 [Candidatus Woesearchaeota archaeon]|nr:hypothetical protein [Candidatus Woesearchaeota archaeon]